MAKKFILSVIFIFTKALLFAQDTTTEPEMADIMRSNGKIYVVVAIVAVIFAGIIIYLINLDRKISRIENSINKK